MEGFLKFTVSLHGDWSMQGKYWEKSLDEITEH